MLDYLAIWKLTVAVAAALVIGVVASGAPSPARADMRAGEFSLGLSANPGSAAEGAEATIEVSVEHSGQPNYQAAQWSFNYNVDLIEVVSINAAAGAPEECGSKNDNGTRVLLGCLDLGGANLSYSGVTFNVVVRCIAGGEATFELSPDPRTFVKVTTDSLPSHRHDTTLNCGGEPPSETSTPQPTRPAATLAPGETRPAGTPPPGSTTAPGDTPAPGETAAGGTQAPGNTPAPGTTASANATVAARTATRGTPSSSTATAPGGSDDDDGGDTAMWVIIGVVAAAGVAAVGGGAYYLMQRRGGV